MARGIIITVVYLGLQVATLFIAAGDIAWPMAWLTTGIYVGISLLPLALADRELVRERSRLAPGANRREPMLAAVSFVFMYPLALGVAGADVMRFGWSPAFHPALHALGIMGFTLGNAIGLWAIVANKYFSTFMRIQTERDHQVVTHGPYRFVRHPGYAGTILAALALPVALGSLWVIIPSILGCLGFGLRTAYEDKALMHQLAGYPAYARRVRFRLIPGLW